MRKSMLTNLNIILFKLSRTKSTYIIFGLFIMLALSYLIVFHTGVFAFAHFMYVPIILSGILLGKRGGLFFSILAGIILGPLMPLYPPHDLITPQPFHSWALRFFIFVLVGFLNGFSFDLVRHTNHTIHRLYVQNIDTGIPNPSTFTDAKESMINPPKHWMIMTLLIHNKDQIVDTLGIDIFYQLLTKIYLKLKMIIPQGSLIVQPDGSKLWMAVPSEIIDHDLIQRIVNLLDKPIYLEDVPLYADTSIGAFMVDRFEKVVSVYSYRMTDVAARIAQKHNLPYQIGSIEQLKENRDITLLGKLAQALEQNHAYLVFQPKVDMMSGNPVGLEALIRWQDPEEGLIMPDRFIPLVEETKLIHTLTEWVIKEAIYKIKEFENLGILLPVAINISAKNLFDPGFLEYVVEMLKAHDVQPHQIELEITESALIQNPEAALTTLQNFNAHQIKIAIDDFGKGYSSLSYLAQLPIQTVKIDRIFIQNLDTYKPSNYIVKAVVDLSHQLGCKVIAEGIENEKSIAILQKLGCDYGQGFYYARPLSEKDFITWFQTTVRV